IGQLIVTSPSAGCAELWFQAEPHTTVEYLQKGVESGDAARHQGIAKFYLL
ncbi:MAG: hypothetical protein LQ343_005815, partial [Gyalolechia ehrenbergii]